MIIDSITDRLANLNGKIGINFINLETNQQLFCGNCDIFPASGSIMLMPLVECFRAMENQELTKEIKYRLSEKQLSENDNPSYGVLRYLHDGVELTLEDLYNIMVTISDNQAFNILVEILGIDNINQTFTSLGYKNMKLNRKINDEKLITRGIENYISVKEMATIFHHIYKGELISRSASFNMLNLLKQHQRTSMIPYIFKESIEIAHLTGFDQDVIVDAGIVLTDSPFVLTMAAADMDVRKAEIIMRDITQICYTETQKNA